MIKKQLVAILVFLFVAGAHAATPVPPDKQLTQLPVEAASAPQFDAAKIGQHTKVMREIHEKMMAASTPEERATLKQEGMKSMQDGMALMGHMRRGMGTDMHMDHSKRGMGMSNDMPNGCNGEALRMDMMDAMMQLMLDQQTPVKQ